MLGFEESYGYLSGTHVRDKDGVNGALIISEMTAFYKNQGFCPDQKHSDCYGSF